MGMNSQPSSTLFIHRHVASAYFEPKTRASRAETFPYLFTPRTQRMGTQWSIDTFEVGIGAVPKRMMQRKEIDVANPRLEGQENYSVLLVLTPEVQEELRDKMAFTFEKSVENGKGDGTYHPETYDIGIQELSESPPQWPLVGMHFFDGYQGGPKLNNRDRKILFDHMIVLKETPNPTHVELQQEDQRPRYEYIMMGKSAAILTQEELKREGRVGDLTEINMLLTNKNRGEDVILFYEGRDKNEIK